jgi:hypothetical protein
MDIFNSFLYVYQRVTFPSPSPYPLTEAPSLGAAAPPGRQRHRVFCGHAAAATGALRGGAVPRDVAAKGTQTELLDEWGVWEMGSVGV